MLDNSIGNDEEEDMTVAPVSHEEFVSRVKIDQKTKSIAPMSHKEHISRENIDKK